MKLPGEREEKLALAREALAGVGDALGKGIDSGIIEHVAILNAVGFNTSGSCEGHADWGYPFPWIDIEAEGRPQFRFAVERRAWEVALSEVRAETGIEDEQILRAEHWDKIDSILKRYPTPDDEPDLPEWKDWSERNRFEVARFGNVVTTFLAERSTELSSAGGDVFVRLSAVDARVCGLLAGERAILSLPWLEFGKRENELPRDEASIVARRRSMATFTSWVKERWLAGEDFV